MGEQSILEGIKDYELGSLCNAIPHPCNRSKHDCLLPIA